LFSTPLRRSTTLLTIIFLTAVLVRLALFAFSQPWEPSWHARLLYSGDPFENVTLARSLVERGDFSITWPEPIPNGIRTPAYPLFLAFATAGQIELLWLAVLVQIFLDSLCATAVAVVVGRCFQNHSLGIISGFAYALMPEAVFWSTQLFAESMGVWFVVAGIGFFSFLPNRHATLGLLNTVHLLAGALFVGLLVLIKPNWLFMPFLAAAWLTCGLLFFWRCRYCIPLGILALTLLFAPLASWLSWNKFHWGNLSMSFGQVMFKQSIATSLIQRSGSQTVPAIEHWSDEMRLHMLTPDFSQPNYMPSSFTTVTSWNPGALAGDKKLTDNQFFELLLKDPLRYVMLHTSGTIYLLTSPGSNFVTTAVDPGFTAAESAANFASSNESLYGLLQKRALANAKPAFWIVWSVIALATLGAIYALTGVFACLLAAKRTSWRILANPWILYLVFAGLSVVLIGAGGGSRYRFTLLVALLPYASWALAYIVRAIFIKRAT
jgi:hypothetical protein